MQKKFSSELILRHWITISDGISNNEQFLK